MANEAQVISAVATQEFLPLNVDNGEHDTLDNKSKGEVSAWHEFETSMVAESVDASLTVQEIQDLRDELSKAKAIIAKVTELANFWAGDHQHSYNAGQMKFALGITAPHWVHPSLVAAYAKTA